MFDDNFFMREAIKEARIAASEDEIPVGAVVVCQNSIVGRGHNQTERLNDVTAHAEILALSAATQRLGGKYLTDCSLYVTVEPCAMCAGALAWAQLKRLIYGAPDSKRGFSLFSPSILHPKTIVVTNVCSEECSKLVLDFFARKRK